MTDLTAKPVVCHDCGNEILAWVTFECCILCGLCLYRRSINIRLGPAEGGNGLTGTDGKIDNYTKKHWKEEVKENV